MQDPNPLPWGALDRYQAHFIVRKNSGSSFADNVAKTILTTKGHFGSKVVTKVQWNGSGELSLKLNADNELNEMIAKQTVKDATIYVEPTDTAVRIRGKWDNHISFGITKELFEIYDRIAGHIKTV
ncbi:MAG: hypothetical protein HOE93_05745 [Nitrosopumilus sp.]|jgi:hypothetical protein|nr:hypothetical protein [Nitrosopumilus sp.]MBT3573370.1 hypothetical protein [Nitrosopumilus sp.]MBT3861698.1 hypothetical protein [Nitrosopumilus sp.]MBT3956795.1 hypothetical protein [Nitrosopumilus sp.]MBT4299136.1 hypothetical protein [Nitrosopumilus sp.]